MCLTLLENRNNHFQVKFAIANYGRILFREFDETLNQVFGRKAKIRGKILRGLPPVGGCGKLRRYGKIDA